MKHMLKQIVVALLTLEAKVLLRRHKPMIIAVTGSVGKTSTKDAIFAVVKHTYRARKSEKSFNSDLGVPLTILGLQSAWNSPWLWLKNISDGAYRALFSKEYPELLVLEMGVDRPGDMAKLTKWIKPEVVVLTRLPDVPVHVEFFASPEAVVAEKMELVKALRPDGVLVYNNDDERVRELIEGVRQRSVGYSRYSLSDFTASADTVVYEDGVPAGLEFLLTHADTNVRLSVRGSLGVQQAYNYTAAVAVGDLFKVSMSAAAAHLAEYVPPAGRMRIIPGLKETLLLDDTYNSSPVAAERALLTLKELHGHKRKIAVLGDMLELGQFSVEEHEKLGALVPECAGMLVTIGVRSRKIAEGALEHGMSEKNILQYDTVERAANELQTLIRPGDMILVKASQGIRAEKLVLELMAEPDKAPELLVRQDVAWQMR